MDLEPEEIAEFVASAQKEGGVQDATKVRMALERMKGGGGGGGEVEAVAIAKKVEKKETIDPAKLKLMSKQLYDACDKGELEVVKGPHVLKNMLVVDLLHRGLARIQHHVQMDHLQENKTTQGQK